MSPVTTVGQMVVTGAKSVSTVNRFCRVATVNGGEGEDHRDSYLNGAPVTAPKINGLL